MSASHHEPIGLSMHPATHQPAWVAAVLAAILSLLALVPLAHAQDADRLSIDVIFGWPDDLGPRAQARTVIVPERWCPATIAIAGPDGGPLTEAFDGLVTFDYVQDATQRSRVSVRVAGTPGRTIAAHAAICVPRPVVDVVVTLTDATGRLRAMSTYTSQMRRDSDRPLPEVASLRSVGVVAVGRVPAVPGPVLNDLRPRDPNQWDYQTHAFSGHLLPSALPAIPAAYASLAALIVDAEEPIDARVHAAIREWVLGGGRLLVIADKPGREWRTWLPPGPLGDLIDIAAPSLLDLPDELAAMAGNPLPAPTTSRREKHAAQDAGIVANPVEAVKPSEPARRVAARALSLTAAGRDEGWTTTWPIGAGNTSGPAPALMASGPVGFGLVTILGIDPRRTNIDQSNPAADRVWDHTLRPLLIDAEMPGRTDTGQPAYLNDWYLSSGESAAGAAALGTAMNLLGDEPPVDGLVIVVSTLCMSGLVLLLGPGDYFILRARRRHLSWITAMGWIALACAGAYIGPSLVRGSESRLQRLSCIDILEPASSSGDADSPNIPALALDSSLTVFWSGRTTGVSVVDDAGNPTAITTADGRSWRGASALPLTRYDQPSMLIPRLNFLQRPASIDSSRDFWGGLGGTDIDGSQAATTAPAPAGLDLRRWTLRATLDSGREPPLIRARARADGSGRTRFEVRNVPAGAVLARAAARLGPARADWCQLGMREAPEITPRGTQVLTLLADRDPQAAEHFERDTQRDQHAGHYAYEPFDAFRPGDALELPGAPARHLAIDTRLASGRWAALYLELDNLAMDVRFTLEGRSSRRAVVRILLPLPADDTR